MNFHDALLWIWRHHPTDAEIEALHNICQKAGDLITAIEAVSASGAQQATAMAHIDMAVTRSLLGIIDKSYHEHLAKEAGGMPPEPLPRNIMRLAPSPGSVIAAQLPAVPTPEDERS